MKLAIINFLLWWTKLISGDPTASTKRFIAIGIVVSCIWYSWRQEVESLWESLLVLAGACLGLSVVDNWINRNNVSKNP